MEELRALSHTGAVRLETDRLILRATSISDAEQMYNNWASDPEVAKYLSWAPHTDIETTKNILAEWDKKNESLDYYHWGIVLKETDEIIGAGGTIRISERHQSADLGYCIGRAYWGRGYMSEAVDVIIKHLFNVVGFNRIAAYHDPDNAASGRVMQNAA